MNLLVLIYLKMTLFFLYFWIWNSGLTFFTFCTLKILSSSDLHCFLRGVGSHSYCFLLFVLCAFLCCFQDFLYVFGCQKIDESVCISMVFFVFIWLGVYRASWICKLVSFTTFRKFSTIPSNILSVYPFSPVILRL